MAILTIPVTQDQWLEIAQLALMKDNRDITEEEYVDQLLSILDMRQRPREGDQLRIVLRDSPRLISIPVRTAKEA